MDLLKRTSKEVIKTEDNRNLFNINELTYDPTLCEQVQKSNKKCKQISIHHKELINKLEYSGRHNFCLRLNVCYLEI